MSEKEKLTGISIPASLVEKIEKRVKETEFDSVSDYISYVLREVLSEEEGEEEQTFTKEDEEKVKERLRALGYLD